MLVHHTLQSKTLNNESTSGQILFRRETPCVKNTPFCNFEEFRKKSDKFFFNSFYMWGKEIADIIPGVKSLDKVNRKRMPKDMKVPKLPSNGGKKEKEEERPLKNSKYDTVLTKS